jgi:drug/metabolite transporter (DMT)-like permease
MERLNGEILAGAALTFLGILFVFASRVNTMWAVTLPADFILLAVGVALIGLGVWTRRNTNRMHSHEEHPHH